MIEYFQDKSIIITGGCGFIGSNLIDKIINFNPHKIIVIDDLSAKTDTRYLKSHINSGKIDFHKIDIRDKSKLDSVIYDQDMIIHLAAQPSVPVSVEKPYFDFEINIIGSMNLLEIARRREIMEFIFAASGGTIYGEATKFPTPEQHPLNPISNYGASKAAFEMYLQSYSHLYDMKCTSLRFGNVFGRRSTHGVVHDLFVKLKNNPKFLEILGDGTQTKSYLHIDDCLNGFITAIKKRGKGFEAINMAGSPPVSVTQIAEMICKEMELTPEFQYTGGKRGWDGDVRYGELDCSKLKSLGWTQKIPYLEGLKSYISWLKSHYDNN